MPHELTHKQNRVAIVHSAITKILNPSKYWMVTIQPFLKDTHLFSASIVYCQFLLLNFYLFSALIDSVLCSIIQCSNYSVYFLFRYWKKYIPGISIPLYNNQPAVKKHHIVVSAIFVLVQEARGLLQSYSRHRGISGTNFSIRVRQTARQYALQKFALTYFTKILAYGEICQTTNLEAVNLVRQARHQFIQYLGKRDSNYDLRCIYWKFIG